MKRFLALGLLLATPLLAADTKLLGDFETDADLAQWNAAGDLTAQLSDEPRAVTLGKHAVKLSFPISTGYPGLHAEARSLLGDWRGFDLFKADFFNPSDKIVTLAMRIDDKQTSKWFTAAYQELSLRPGKNTIEFSLATLRTADGTRALDLQNIRGFSFHRGEPKEPAVVFLDNVRLEKSATATDAVPGLRAFDFGPANSPIWPGMTRVTAKSAFNAQQGFGWLDKENFEEGNDNAPDALAGDWVGGSYYGPFLHSFRVDVADGEYGVAMIVRPPTPVRTYRVTIGGTTAIEKKITPETALTTDNLFAGLNREHDSCCCKDAFANYVDAEFQVRVGRATAKGGQLSFAFDSCNVHFLAVWPVAEQRAAEKWLVALHNARRDEFFRKFYFLNLPTERNAPRDWAAADFQRGYVVFTRPLHRPIFPHTVPAESERCAKLSVTVPRGGVAAATFAMYSLEHLSRVTVTASAGIELREVRYTERQGPPGVFTPTPDFLAPPTVADLPPGSIRQFWLTVHDGAKSGEVTIQEAGRAATKIPVSINVLPFALPPLKDFTVSYYYAHPDNPGMNYRYGLTGDAAGARAMLRRELRDLKEHGCNGVSLEFPESKVSRGKDGKVTVQLDFTKLDDEIAALREVGFDMSHEMLMSTLGFANYRLMRVGLKEFSPEFNAAFLDAIGQIQDWATGKGIRVLFWAVDEPREQMINDWNRNLAGTLKYLELFRQHPGLRTTVTPMGDIGDGLDYTAMVPLLDVLQTHPWPGSAKTIAMVKQNPRQQLWLYNAGMSRLVFGFYPWSVGAHGYWQWHYQWREHPFDLFHEGEGAVYPSPSGPLPTIAYELSREGITDLRCIYLLESLIARAEQGTDANAKRVAAKARSTLQEIRAAIPAYPDTGQVTGAEAGTAKATTVDDKLDAWRAQIIELITALSR